MAKKYLLPCSQCQHVHSVESGQAGMMLACQCGAEVEVPTLLALQNLERVEEAGTQEAATGWGPRQGLFFLGLVLTLCGLSTSALLWSTIPDYHPIQFDEDSVAAQFQRMSLRETFEHWEQVDNTPIRFVPDNNLLQWRQTKTNQQNWAIVSLVFGVLGVGLACSAAFFSKTNTTASQR